MPTYSVPGRLRKREHEVPREEVVTSLAVDGVGIDEDVGKGRRRVGNERDSARTVAGDCRIRTLIALGIQFVVAQLAVDVLRREVRLVSNVARVLARLEPGPVPPGVDRCLIPLVVDHENRARSPAPCPPSSRMRRSSRLLFFLTTRMTWLLPCKHAGVLAVRIEVLVQLVAGHPNPDLRCLGGADARRVLVAEVPLQADLRLPAQGCYAARTGR